MTTPTPRTEAARIDNADLSDWGTGKSDYVHADFARQLEQELDEQIIKKAELFVECGRRGEERDTLKRERDEAREENAQLTAELDMIKSKNGQKQNIQIES